jgi:hypothetical protein
VHDVGLDHTEGARVHPDHPHLPLGGRTVRRAPHRLFRQQDPRARRLDPVQAHESLPRLSGLPRGGAGNSGVVLVSGPDHDLGRTPDVEGVGHLRRDRGGQPEGGDERGSAEHRADRGQR